MPFFDIPIPKPFGLKALSVRSSRRRKVSQVRAKDVRTALGGTFSVRRPSWAKLGRPQSKGMSKPQNHDMSHDNDRGNDNDADEERAGKELQSRVRVVRRVLSSPCLGEGEETSEGNDGEEYHGRHSHRKATQDHRELRRFWSKLHEEHENERRWGRERPWTAMTEDFRMSYSHMPAGSMCGHEENSCSGSEWSDSDETSTAVATPDGPRSATPTQALSRANSYSPAQGKKTGLLVYPEFSIPFQKEIIDLALLKAQKTVVDPHGVRLVSKMKAQGETGLGRYDEVLALPSFRPLHPAIAFDHEGF